jgi:RNA polymerase sigma factor (sigma-70 family)
VTYDELLFKGALDGDAQALEEILVRGWATIRRSLGRRMGFGHPDVDDVVQNAWLRFHGGWQRWRGGSSIERFAYGFARNALLDYYRSWGRENGRRGLLPDDWACGIDVERDATIEELLVVVREAVAALSHPRRVAFEMWADGSTRNQIAEALGVAPGTAAATLFHARKLVLQHLLEKGCDLPPDG